MSLPPNTMPAGATRLRTFLAAHLEAKFPPMLVAAREQFQMEPHLLPDPVRYNAYDPLSADVFPIAGAYINRTTNWTRVDINEMAEEVYEARYNIGVFLWVRTPMKPDNTWEAPAYDQTIRLRDDMLSLLRATLLGWPGLGSNGVVALDEATFSEDYPDAIKARDQSSSWMAGGIINCEARVRETNYLTRLATADQIVVEAGPIQEEAT